MSGIAWSVETTLEQHNPTPFAEPELAVLVHFLIDEPVDLATKVQAVEMWIEARGTSSNGQDAIHRVSYYELFLAMAAGCAAVVNTPEALGGSVLYSTLRRMALCGVLPSVMAAVEAKRRTADTMSTTASADIDAAVRALFEYASATLEQCESNAGRTSLAGEPSTDPDTVMMEALMEEQGPGADRIPVRAMLLRSLTDKGLINLDAWPSARQILEAAQDRIPPATLTLEAQSTAASSLRDYVVDRIGSGASIDDGSLVQALQFEHAVQDIVSEALLEATNGWATNHELDMLSRVYALLLEDEVSLHTWLAYVSPARALETMAILLDDDNLLQSGEDPATLASTALFGQWVVQLGLAAGASLQHLLPSTRYRFLPALIRSISANRPIHRWSAAEQEVIGNWITALFGSEGISDDLIRSSSPQLLMRIAPTIFTQSIMANVRGVIDGETLRGGLTYFLQDLLVYTLPGALRAVMADVNRYHTLAQIPTEGSVALAAEVTEAKRCKEACIDVLHEVLLTDSCPMTIKRVVAVPLLDLLERCQALGASEKLGQLITLLTPIVQAQQQLHRTDLWIKVAQASAAPSPSDPLLNVNASLHSTLVQRGVQAVVSLIRKTMQIDGQSGIQRSVAFGLALITLQDIRNQQRATAGPTSLADDHTVRIAVALLQPQRQHTHPDTTITNLSCSPLITLLSSLCAALDRTERPEGKGLTESEHVTAGAIATALQASLDVARHRQARAGKEVVQPALDQLAVANTGS